MSDSVILKWNDAAASYAENQENSLFADANRAVVKARFTELRGKRVLDLGCGYGNFTDYFRSIGAEVIGVDGAQTMIDIAKKRYPESAFAVADITRPLPFESGEFDVVFCNLVLMDIENIESIFSECNRVLAPGGILYYSIVHPAFYNGEWKTDEDGKTGKLITSYITPGERENHFWGSTKHFHRPLSYYLNRASEAGFMLVHSEEPRAYHEATKNEDIPLFFFAEYRKQG